jgi:hypothetical protein
VQHDVDVAGRVLDQGARVLRRQRAGGRELAQHVERARGRDPEERAGLAGAALRAHAVEHAVRGEQQLAAADAIRVQEVVVRRARREVVQRREPGVRVRPERACDRDAKNRNSPTDESGAHVFPDLA